MRYAVISDVHSNLEALVTVLKEIESKNVDEIICLGDIVGYGANPDEVAEIVRNEAKYVVRGNHDDAVFNIASFDIVNSYAKAAITYTRGLLTEANSKWLKELPLTQAIDNVLLVHASPSEPDGWNYIFSEQDARVELASFEERVCLIGHTHVPVIFKERIRNDPEHRWRELINVGSVGQPRDGDNRASFGVIDTDNFTYENFRVEYNYETASRKIIAAGLPPLLGERLKKGR